MCRHGRVPSPPPTKLTVEMLVAGMRCWALGVDPGVHSNETT